MGADLILAFPAVPHKKTANGFEVIDDLEAVVKVALARAANTPIDDILNSDPSFYRFDELLTKVEEDSEVTREEVNEVISQMVAEFLNCFDGRDVALITLDKPRLFTGGMSWGDEPSDSFQICDEIGALSLFEEPIEDSELA